jgi:hypothetical protein
MNSYYDPSAKSSLWYLAWRHNIHEMKRYPDRYSGYSRAAVIANAQYVLNAALEAVKEQSK